MIIVGILEGLNGELIEELEATAELVTVLELLTGVTLLLEVPVFALEAGFELEVYGVEGVKTLLA